MIYPLSSVKYEGSLYFLHRSDSGEKHLGIRGDSRGFEQPTPGPQASQLFPLSPANAAALRARLPWLNPVPLGLRTSFGTGDRLGLATPGHVRALRGSGLAPIFAQQSVRENNRTGRTPQQVMDDALWGLFQEGWREPWGADADHLKTLEDLPAFLNAGYSFFTVDPGFHVQSTAPTESLESLRNRFSRLDWSGLELTPGELRAAYLNRTVELQGCTLTFDEPSLLCAALKYANAVVHAARMARHLKSLRPNQPFDFEISVDETDSPTTPEEHFFIAAELRRLGVEWVSLAPRLVGSFEKGVDYMGDRGELDASLIQHAAVMDFFGGYKLSLHSGSDKFSIYGMVNQRAHGRVHVKTAGTSYLEALRVLSEIDPAFFRKVMDFSLRRYHSDRASYHVSARPERIPPLNSLENAALPRLLDAFDARQVLHVAFGSVLETFGPELIIFLSTHEELYNAGLEKHFKKHLQPFQEK